MAEYRFDRSISAELMDKLRPGGSFHGLLERRAASPDVLDVQLRHDQRGRRSWVSVYLGLTSVLDVDERRGAFRLRAHATHRSSGTFDDAWLTWQSAAQMEAAWPAVEGYLDRILADGMVDARHLQREGLVHGALASGRSEAFGAVQREATVWFRSSSAQRELTDPWRHRIWMAMREAGRADDAWWPGVRDRGQDPRLGLEADLLGVDSQGRLLVIEAKPSSEVKGLAWGPAQVRLYAEMFAALLDDNPVAGEALDRMTDQRAALGLLDPGWRFAPQPGLPVVPVLAVGAGPRSPVTFERIAAVAAALEAAPQNDRIQPLEVWLLGPTGHPETIWCPSAQSAPDGLTAPSGSPSRFAHQAAVAAARWKQQTSTLNDDQRAPGVYEDSGPLAVCLPPEHRSLNLLPDARLVALSRFATARIRWHGGVGISPSNHLLSSQVQCVNALAPLVERPADLARLFKSVLPIEHVLPFGGAPSGYDCTDHVVFEWQGLVDHLGEWGTTPPTRGAYSTSADAAIRYRTPEGRTELALIEWKYTERYPHGALSGGPAKQATRYGRYRAGFDDPSGPIRHDVVSYEDLFYEPVYQLFRQALLAWRLEQANELGADVVRVVYVAPGANDALWTSLPTPHWRRLGGAPRPLLTAWTSVLRRPDRFVWLDSAAVTSPESPTSTEFKSRYADLIAGTTLVPAEAQAPDGAEISVALEHLLMVLRRVGGDGSVLESALAAGTSRLSQLDPGLRSELVARASELAEMARLFRAEPLSRVADVIS